MMDAEASVDATDEAIMHDLAAGNEAALAAMMVRWEKPLRRFIYRLVQNGADAEELAQETFVKLYGARGRFRQGMSFAPWIFSIASNLAKNRLRWRRVRRLVSLNAPRDEEERKEFEKPDVAAATGLEATERTERAEAVRAAIAELPFDLRTALVLAEYEGRSHAEIALALGCSPKAVETRLYRARAALRRRLAAWVV